jgi:hypothetical protein
LNIEESINKISQLHPVTFNYLWNLYQNTSLQTGFLAQEVKEVFPDMVSGFNPLSDYEKELAGQDNQLYTVNMANNFNAHLVNCVKYLTNKNSQLNTRVVELEEKVQQILQRLP